MININCLLEIVKYDEKEDNLVDVILDVDVSDEYYQLKNLSEEEYPKDAWEVWVTQNDYDRQHHKFVWVSLCNEGSEVDEYIGGNEKEKILRYIIDNNLDVQAGLSLPDFLYANQ